MITRTRKLLINIATGVAIACTAAVVLTPSMASAAPAQASAAANVRSAPNGRIVDSLYRGENVDVKGCRNGWCYITHSGPDGYVSANYLTASGGHRMDPNFNLSFNFGNGSISIGTGGVGIGIGQPPVETRDQVCFYADNNYQGASFCLDSRTQISQLGSSWNDRISSIRNTDGRRVTVCTDWNFGGDCRTYTSSTRSVSDFNDEISSIRVR